MTGCTKCGRKVHQTIEKALAGDPREAVVWADDQGGWTCEVDGDEHTPSDDLLPYEVEFTVTIHVLAEDAEDAFTKAEPHAVQAAKDMAWTNYDDCARRIEDSQF